MGTLVLMCGSACANAWACTWESVHTVVGVYTQMHVFWLASMWLSVYTCPHLLVLTRPTSVPQHTCTRLCTCALMHTHMSTHTIPFFCCMVSLVRVILLNCRALVFMRLARVCQGIVIASNNLLFWLLHVSLTGSCPLCVHIHRQVCAPTQHAHTSAHSYTTPHACVQTCFHGHVYTHILTGKCL